MSECETPKCGVEPRPYTWNGKSLCGKCIRIELSNLKDEKGGTHRSR
jgi:hypothetical protein